MAGGYAISSLQGTESWTYLNDCYDKEVWLSRFFPFWTFSTLTVSQYFYLLNKISWYTMSICTFQGCHSKVFYTWHLHTFSILYQLLFQTAHFVLPLNSVLIHYSSLNFTSKFLAFSILNFISYGQPYTYILLNARKSIFVLGL